MLQKTVLILKPDIYTRAEREVGSELSKPLGNPEEFIEYIKTLLGKLDLCVIEERKETLSLETSKLHYDEHKNITEKFNFLLGFMTSGPSYVMLVEGDDAIKKVRNMIMEIREEFLETPKKARCNMTHASDSPESAEREINIHFNNNK